MAQLRTDLIIGAKTPGLAAVNRFSQALSRMKKLGQMGIGQRMGVVADNMKRSSMHATGLGLGLGLVARQGFLAAYGMEKTMNKLQAVGTLTAEQREEFQKMAMILNKDFPYTNKEIAEAGVELMKAGLTFEQARGALKDTLRMAMAGDIERGEAADIATNVLTAMRLPMKTAEQVEASLRRVVDNLSYAATKSNTDIRRMGETFKYVAPIAAAAGISIEKVSAMSMVMANNGIKASEAGVALRSAIVKMVRPTTFALQAFDRLKINIGDFIKNGRKIKSEDIIGGLRLDGIDAAPFKKRLDKILSSDSLQNKPAQLAATITEELATALGSDSVVDKQALAKAIQNTVMSSASEVDLVGLMSSLMEKGASLQDIAKIFGVKQSGRLMTLLTADLNAKAMEVLRNSKGATERMASIMMGGIVGSAAKLKASWENLWITIGETGILDQISHAFNNMAVGLERISKTNPELLKLGTYAMGALAVLGPLGFLMTGVAASVTMLGGAFSMAGLAVAGLGKILAGPFIAAAVGARKALLMLTLAGSIGGGGRLAMLGGSLLAMLNPLNMLKKGFLGAGVAMRGLLAGAAMLGAIAWPVLLGGAAIAAVIGYWDELKAFFTGFFDEFDKAFDEAGLGRPLAALGEMARSLGDAIGVAVKWVRELFGFTGNDDHFGWMEAGRAAARGLATAISALLAPIKSAYNWLSKLFNFSGKAPAPGGKAAAPIEARARGGPILAGRPYLVGERGPELVMPSRNGFVLPNHKLGGMGGRTMNVGDITVNVTPSSPVDNVAAFGREVGRAVRNAVLDAHNDGAYA